MSAYLALFSFGFVRKCDASDVRPLAVLLHLGLDDLVLVLWLLLAYYAPAEFLEPGRVDYQFLKRIPQ